MTEHTLNSDRRVVPRWRSLKGTFAHGELSIVSSNTNSPSISAEGSALVAARLQEWKQDPGVRTAADLLSTARSHAQHNQAIEAASFLNSRVNELSAPLKQIVQQVLFEHSDDPLPSGTLSPQAIVQQIRDLRRQLVLYPRNPIGFCESARYYSLLGQLEQSRTAMLRAVSLAQSNRYVLRCACRFLIHAGDPETAHSILIRSGLSSDPWILSAEAATANAIGESPTWFRHAKRVLGGSKAPFELAELNAAIASNLAESGNRKQARKLLKAAMIDPTENVIAHAQWMGANRDIDVIASNTDLTRRSAEAHARLLFDKGDFAGCLGPISRWQDDQPFSVSPAALGSFVSSCTLGDHEGALEYLRLGLQANPHDPLLVNNEIFALAKLGRTDNIRDKMSFLRSIAKNPYHRYMADATAGLVAFRTNDYLLGRKLYQSAIDGFHSLGDQRAEAIALLNYVDELNRVKLESWHSLILKLDEMLKSEKSAHIVALRQTLSNQIEARKAITEQDNRSIAQ